MWFWLSQAQRLWNAPAFCSRHQSISRQTVKYNLSISDGHCDMRCKSFSFPSWKINRGWMGYPTFLCVTPSRPSNSMQYWECGNAAKALTRCLILLRSMRVFHYEMNVAPTSSCIRCTSFGCYSMTCRRIYSEKILYVSVFVGEARTPVAIGRTPNMGNSYVNLVYIPSSGRSKTLRRPFILHMIYAFPFSFSQKMQFVYSGGRSSCDFLLK